MFIIQRQIEYIVINKNGNNDSTYADFTVVDFLISMSLSLFKM